MDEALYRLESIAGVLDLCKLLELDKSDLNIQYNIKLRRFSDKMRNVKQKFSTMKYKVKNAETNFKAPKILNSQNIFC